MEIKDIKDSAHQKIEVRWGQSWQSSCEQRFLLFPSIIFWLWEHGLLDRNGGQRLEDRDEDEVKVLQSGGHLSQEGDVELKGQQPYEEDVPDLQEPAGKEPEHADGVGVVALLDHRLLQDGRSDVVVVVGDVVEEHPVAEHLDEVQGDACAGDGQENSRPLVSVEKVSRRKILRKDQHFV